MLCVLGNLEMAGNLGDLTVVADTPDGYPVSDQANWLRASFFPRVQTVAVSEPRITRNRPRFRSRPLWPRCWRFGQLVGTLATAKD